MYLEREPSSFLNKIVKCYWSFEVKDTSNTDSHLVSPDNFVDILYLPNEKRTFFSGPMTKYFYTINRTIYAVRLYPNAINSILEIPIFEVKDKNVDFSDAFNLEKINCHKMNQIKSFNEFIDHFDKTLPPPLGRYTLNPIIAYMVRELASGSPLSLVKQRIGFSDQHITRLFKKNVGLSPKQFERIERFKRLKRLLGNSEYDLTDLGLRIGYYDQSHMINEVKYFTGKSPGNFFK